MKVSREKVRKSSVFFQPQQLLEQFVTQATLVRPSNHSSKAKAALHYGANW